MSQQCTVFTQLRTWLQIVKLLYKVKHHCLTDNISTLKLDVRGRNFFEGMPLPPYAGSIWQVSFSPLNNLAKHKLHFGLETVLQTNPCKWSFDCTVKL